MSSIKELWQENKTTLEGKTLSQILTFAGDGKLRDGNSTSKEFRELLDQVPSKLLKHFASNCLVEKFDDGGLALQDIVNQIGVRLGFETEYGLYKGKSNNIGFDGIWTSREGHSLIVEVKTSDAYRINLDTIAEYRIKLIDQKRVNKIDSSILIIVGRQDTGDLEAQIRGSRHAWDIRLLSTDSLLNLLSLKETLNDAKTIQQINELLKPKEYTRIDKLIELIFLTSQDLQIDESIEEIEESLTERKKRKPSENKTIPVNFHDQCLQKIQDKLGTNLIKQSRISYANKDKTTALICAISRPHKQGQYEKYWFAFHPHHQEFLNEYKNSFVAFGCGSSENTFLIPFKDFKPFIKNFWITEDESRMYWHVVIYHKDKRFLLAQPRDHQHEVIDITKYKI